MLRLAVLTLLLVARAVARPLQPKGLAKPDYSIYHTMAGVFQEVADILQKCPAIMRIDEETQQEGKYSSTLSVVTVEPGGLSEDHSNKIRLLLNFGEHGRELISSEIGLRLLRLLCDEAQRGPLLDAYSIPREAVQQLLQRAVFKIVPMENIRGRERVESGELCLRKNGRGVDPNRNWDVHWGFKEKDYDPEEEYPGTGPFSEPEASLMLRTARALRPHVWASVHSGMEALFMPYDHKGQIPEGEAAASTLSILQQLNERTCKKRCVVGSGGKSVGYLAHGTATDYMYDKLGVPISMTWEVYGDQKAAFNDCFRMFNPLTPAVFNQTVESWTAAFFALLTLLPQHPQIQQELQLLVAATAVDGAAATSRTAAEVVAASEDGSSGGSSAEGAGAGSTQQQEEQQTKEDAAAASDAAGKQTSGAADEVEVVSTGESGSGSGSETSSSSSSSSLDSSADKALEIAAVLKEHTQQQQQQGEEAAAAAAAAADADGTQSGSDALAAQAGSQLQVPAAQRGHMGELLYWVIVGVTGCAFAWYLWSKPRVRFQLSKWLGASRRRQRTVIPL